MQKTFKNVHVAIYGHEMLQEAVKRIERERMTIEDHYHRNYDNGNDILVFRKGKFGMIACPVNHPTEVSLNQLIELIVGGSDD
ncbi:hypothetical protein [Sphingobacterium griseoflavum]|uniref:Uncharacterized protein n=1 Tax=Sphingobacterium griseoflavum TaxID=1474952 RepID=A0ABQ3HZL5_9SPHI|nr:hypothetical protein [Sphingobacterium griseoflavum]GHE35099.1 hypothetical protein GCM10017764_17910 [Sphingobacterium griseoflavum]